jgi:hypothetical protein
MKPDVRPIVEATAIGSRISPGGRGCRFPQVSAARHIHRKCIKSAMEDARDTQTHAFDQLVLDMARFDEDSDAWKDFAADCETRLLVSPHGGPSPVIVPNDIWTYWQSVAEGTSGLYDQGVRRGRAID